MDAPGNFSYKKEIVLLSGPRAWSLAETVNLLGNVVGKEVKLIQVDAVDNVADPLVGEKMHSHGPGDPARDWTMMFEAVRRGQTSAVSTELGRSLGRASEDFEKTVRAVARKQTAV